MAYNGTSPHVFDPLPLGNYSIEITLTGYRTVTDTVSITDLCDIEKTYTLVEQGGKLTVTTTPAGASITVTLQE